MTRPDDDTWDLASSVGANATMVPAERAIANKTEPPTINDPFAEPVVRAAGVEFRTRWADGKLTNDDIDVDEPGLGYPTDSS